MQFHKIFRLVFAFSVGIALAIYMFQKVSDPEPAQARAREEVVVLAARQFLKESIPAEVEIQVVDPLATNRVAGKVYIYPSGDGWQVSGHYRRSNVDRWHPFLMTLDENIRMTSLAVRDSDPALGAAAENNPRLSVTK